MGNFLSRLKAAAANLRLEQSRIVITRGESRVDPDAPTLSMGGTAKVRAFKPSVHRIDLYDCPAVALAKARYNAQATGENEREILEQHERMSDGRLKKGRRKA